LLYVAIGALSRFTSRGRWRAPKHTFAEGPGPVENILRREPGLLETSLLLLDKCGNARYRKNGNDGVLGEFLIA